MGRVVLGVVELTDEDLCFYRDVDYSHFSIDPHGMTTFWGSSGFGWDILCQVLAVGEFAIYDFPPFLRTQPTAAHLAKNLNFGLQVALIWTRCRSHQICAAENLLQWLSGPYLSLGDSLCEFHSDVPCLDAKKLADSKDRWSRLAHKFGRLALTQYSRLLNLGSFSLNLFQILIFLSSIQ